MKWQAKLALGAAGLALGACSPFGPQALKVGRLRYNDAIHHTSAEQVLANIVRVAHQEMPLVMDVTQVNAALIVQGTVTPSLAGIGGLAGLQGAGAAVGFPNGSGALGSKVVTSQASQVAASLEYEENPTITYTPLSGQALIAQLSTPIGVDSLADLPDSEWPLPALLTLATNYITPRVDDEDMARNALFKLDALNMLNEAATKSSLSSKPSGSDDGLAAGSLFVQPLARLLPALQRESNGEPANDSISFYLTPLRG